MISATTPLSIPQVSKASTAGAEPTASGASKAVWTVMSSDSSGVKPVGVAGEARPFNLDGVNVDEVEIQLVTNTTSKGTGGAGGRRRI